VSDWQSHSRASRTSPCASSAATSSSNELTR
jgi:hypothetical protein